MSSFNLLDGINGCRNVVMKVESALLTVLSTKNESFDSFYMSDFFNFSHLDIEHEYYKCQNQYVIT